MYNVLHPSIESIIDFTGAPPEKINELLDLYDIFQVSFDDGSVFLCRGITSAEYNQLIKKYEESELDIAIMELCLLAPDIDFTSDDMLAGYTETVAMTILEESGYGVHLEHATALLEKERKDMESFVHQLPCIVHEAFQDMPMEQILNLPFSKLAWYYARAEWILANFRMTTQQLEQEQDTGDEGDFPELRAEKQFFKQREG